MQTIKPRARQITACRGEPYQWTYWIVNGHGFEASGVCLEFTLARWNEEQLARQTNPAALE
jgi:hypothetical protein